MAIGLSGIRESRMWRQSCREHASDLPERRGFLGYFFCRNKKSDMGFHWRSVCIPNEDVGNEGRIF